MLSWRATAREESMTDRPFERKRFEADLVFRALKEPALCPLGQHDK